MYTVSLHAVVTVDERDREVDVTLGIDGDSTFDAEKQVEDGSHDSYVLHLARQALGLGEDEGELKDVQGVVALEGNDDIDEDADFLD